MTGQWSPLLPSRCPSARRARAEQASCAVMVRREKRAPTDSVQGEADGVGWLTRDLDISRRRFTASGQASTEPGKMHHMSKEGDDPPGAADSSARPAAPRRGTWPSSSPLAEAHGPIVHTIFRISRKNRAMVANLLRPLGLYPGQELLMMQLWEHKARSQADLRPRGAAGIAPRPARHAGQSDRRGPTTA